ncbi:MAG: hypothetical protein L0312_25190, partial [Acidobacteria bacterium]|nr:hypothetical protein [Acidobacteriota bacterium]
LNAPLPHYRFQVLAQKASELISEVKSLGATFLGALEKRDAEELALLRATLEVQLLETAEEIKVQQREEALEAKGAFEEAKSLASKKKMYYQKLLDHEAENVIEVRGVDISDILEVKELGLTSAELAQLTLSAGAAVLGTVAVLPQMLSGHLSLIPSFSFGIAGAGGSPLNSISFGGSNFSGAASAASGVLQQLASLLDRGASIAGTIASYRRRADEWRHQAGLAEGERIMIEKQIEAAKIRITIAEREIQQHKKQIEQSRQIHEFMKRKYTNQELYGWMISQLTTVYFQIYQLAYDTAKRAERAFQHELGVSDVSFIQFGYWDNLKKGLLSGEKLYHDLKRMEVAYLEENRREYEITQHFSLALLDARALLQLRETGECEFSMPELAFDIGYPGHYMRRIKSASVSVPCVTGPYTNVSARLTLLRNRVRVNGSSQQNYEYTGIDDPNFRHDLIGIQSIATSTGQNDSGLFQFNFQDERYLPFERAGA